MMKPVLIGAAMAAMMLWMLHEPIMSGGLSLSVGAMAFVLAHVAALLALGAVALLVPRVRKTMTRHRPDIRHMAAMLASMVMSASGIHVILHGGL